MNGLLDFLQSASNMVAGNVAGPVDLLGMGLNKIGLDVGAAPVGGSEWMKRQGLMRDVDPGAARVLGETAGLLGPAMASHFAPQIAKGLLQVEANAMAPRTLNSQSGMLKIPGRGQIPETAGDVKKLSERFGKLLDDSGIDYAYDKSNLSPARYFMIDKPSAPDEMFTVRISDHRNVHGADFSVDPHTGSTFEEMLDSLRGIGVPVKNRVSVDRSMQKKVFDATRTALDIGEGSLLRKAIKKYGGPSTDAFKAAYPSLEQRMYEIANLPKAQYTKQHLDEIQQIMKSLD